jgi:hypothetical protein
MGFMMDTLAYIATAARARRNRAQNRRRVLRNGGADEETGTAALMVMTSGPEKHSDSNK